MMTPLRPRCCRACMCSGGGGRAILLLGDAGSCSPLFHPLREGACVWCGACGVTWGTCWKESVCLVLWPLVAGRGSPTLRPPGDTLRLLHDVCVTTALARLTVRGTTGLQDRLRHRWYGAKRKISSAGPMFGA